MCLHVRKCSVQVIALQRRVAQLESENDNVSSELRAAKEKMTSRSLLHEEALTNLNSQLVRVCSKSGVKYSSYRFDLSSGERSFCQYSAAECSTGN